MANATSFDARQPATVPGRGWQIAWGVLLLLAGVPALMMPAVAASPALTARAHERTIP
jgi:uncharacterized membrane protein HdeD (DUF308 family)